MQLDDVLVEQPEGGRWTIVTFRGSKGEVVVVRVPEQGEADRSREMLIGSARAALLDVVSATEAGNPLPLADVEVDASGRTETPTETRPLEEEDDNPYQRPDEALPDSEEESELLRNPSRESGRFGED